MDVFQDLLMRLNAAHDREVSSLQRKLERSYAENSELLIRLDTMQGLVGGWTRSLRNYPPESPRGDATRTIQKPPNDSLMYQAQFFKSGDKSKQFPTMFKKDSVVDTESTRSGDASIDAPTTPGWNTAPAARSRSPSPMSPNKSPRQRTRGCFLGWASDPELARSRTLFDACDDGQQAQQPAGKMTSRDADVPLLPGHETAQDRLDQRSTDILEASWQSGMPDVTLSSRSKSPGGERRKWRFKDDAPLGPHSPRRPSPVRSTELLSANIGEMIQQFRDHVRQHGDYGDEGVAGISRKFMVHDADHNGALDKHEVAKVLKDLGFEATIEQANDLIGQFDTDGDGMLNYKEFLIACRPPMNLRRRRLVQKVFESLDPNDTGVLTADLIKQKFNPQQGRDSRGKTNEELADEFLSRFDIGDYGNVTLGEFTAFYQGVSATIDDDNHFELMLRNAWHLSGGKGRLQNTTCLRVMVTHTNGTQRVVEIKNDLGLDKRNHREVEARLRKQGITDILYIDMTGTP